MSVIIVGSSKAGRYFSEGVFRCPSLVEATQLKSLHEPHSVLIVGANAALPPKCELFAAAVDADGGFDAAPLKGIAVLSCGMGGRNTISLSSRTPEIVTLSLNRSVTTLGGVCEPFELPVRLIDGTSDYDVMSAFAAAVALGTLNPENP